jgi:hypothetical protein
MVLGTAGRLPPRSTATSKDLEHNGVNNAPISLTSIFSSRSTRCYETYGIEYWYVGCSMKICFLVFERLSCKQEKSPHLLAGSKFTSPPTFPPFPDCYFRTPHI